jgi:hypothetical protein
MQRNRIIGLFVEPFFEDLHGLADLAECAVRQCQKPSRIPVLRLQRDHLAIARRRFLRSLQPVEQDAQVGVRVNMLWIQLNSGAIRSFRLGRFSGRPNSTPRLL